jgi:hypothetical protein
MPGVGNVESQVDRCKRAESHEGTGVIRACSLGSKGCQITKRNCLCPKLLSTKVTTQQKGKKKEVSIVARFKLSDEILICC